MRALLTSPIGATRRVLENWMQPLGYKVLTAESFDSAARQLHANPAIELVITEWILGGYTAYDLLMKARQVTRLSDVAEESGSVRFVVMVTPGWQNARLNHQMDAIKAIDHATLVEKPINRDAIARAIQKCYPVKPMTPVSTASPVLSVASPAANVASISSSETAAAGVTGCPKTTLGEIAQLHAATQQKLQQLSTLLN